MSSRLSESDKIEYSAGAIRFLFSINVCDTSTTICMFKLNFYSQITDTSDRLLKVVLLKWLLVPFHSRKKKPFLICID